MAPYCPTSWYGYQERLSGVFADAMWIRDSTRPIEFLQRNRDHRRNYTNTPIGLDQLDDEPWAHRLCEQPDQPWLRPRVPEELYDLAADPNEQRNLAGDPGVGAVRTALQAQLARHLQTTGDRLDAPVRPGVTPPRP